jgi:transcriptional regulator with PAS, ATPase and Fis domain
LKSTISNLPRPTGHAARRGAPFLRLLHAPGQGHGDVFPLATSATVDLGREARPGAIAIAGDPRLSRSHARVDVSSDGWSVRLTDGGSHNGTFVNRVALARGAATSLADGDIVRVGDSFLIFRLAADDVRDAAMPELVGVSPGAAQLRATIVRVAADRATVLLRGETGTGKEVIASALHRLSGRAGVRVSVNCSAIPQDLAESQLFGHVAGAFTGARTHPGFFRAAHLGTLFLDEIGDLLLPLQPKLLRALEERTVTPLGGAAPLPCDVRLVAATNRDLERAVTEGGFRGDLFARISDVVIRVPPLRDRREDILPLLRHAGADPSALSSQLIEQLLFHPWLHNVRELWTAANHLRLFGPDDAFVARLLPSQGAPPPTVEPPRQRALSAPTRDQLIALLEKHRGIVLAVAGELGCSRRQVGRWIDEHAIERAAFRK